MQQVDHKGVTVDKVVLHYSDGKTEEYDQFVGAFSKRDVGSVYTMFANIDAATMMAFMSCIIKAGQQAFTQKLLDESTEAAMEEMK